jgi:O-antigen/teichoic acid export membrane protein
MNIIPKEKKISISLIFSYLSQGYVSLIAIITLPIYISLLTPSEYGLIGSHILLSQWLQMLTVGLAPTLARYVAIRDTLKQNLYSDVVHNIEIMFLIIAIITIFIVFNLPEQMVRDLFKQENISTQLISDSIKIIGIIICISWFVALYSSGLSGLEEFRTISILNIIFGTMRYIGGLVLLLIKQDVLLYFYYQMIVGICEVAAFQFAYYYLSKKSGFGLNYNFRLSPHVLRKILPFALSTGYTAIVWIVVSQYDKMLLTVSFNLEEIGYFAFGMLLANGLFKITDPIFTVLTPRLTAIASENNDRSTSRTFRSFTLYIVVISITSATFLIVFGDEMLMAVTQNLKLVTFLSPLIGWIFATYALFLIAKSYFMLQVAHGDLKIHVLIGTLGLVVQIPILTLVSEKYGPIEILITFFVVRVLIFMLQTALVAKRFKIFTFSEWILKILLFPTMMCILSSHLCYEVFNQLSGNIIYGQLRTLISLAVFLALIGLVSFYSVKFTSKIVEPIGR